MTTETGRPLDGYSFPSVSGYALDGYDSSDTAFEWLLAKAETAAGKVADQT
jgi:hypothetical protein